MLTRREDVEIHALKERGWKISAIARHVGRDRKTVRSYLAGDRVPGVRVSVAPDALAPFEEYIRGWCPLGWWGLRAGRGSTT
jgi:transposase